MFACEKQTSTNNPLVGGIIFLEVVLENIFLVTDVENLKMKLFWVCPMQEVEEEMVLVVAPADLGKVGTHIRIDPAKLACVEGIPAHRLQDEIEFAATDEVAFCTGALISSGVVALAILCDEVSIRKGGKRFHLLDYVMGEMWEAGLVGADCLEVW